MKINELKENFGKKSDRSKATISITPYHKAALRVLVDMSTLSGKGASDMSSLIEELIQDRLSTTLKKLGNNSPFYNMIVELMEKEIEG